MPRVLGAATSARNTYLKQQVYPELSEQEYIAASVRAITENLRLIVESAAARERKDMGIEPDD